MMAEQMKTQITPAQITFVERMEKELLPNRQHVNSATMKEIGALVGISINTSCRSCTQAGGADLLNLYGQLKPRYDEYMKTQIPVTTHFEAVEEPIEEVKIEPKTIKKIVK